MTSAFFFTFSPPGSFVIYKHVLFLLLFYANLEYRKKKILLAAAHFLQEMSWMVSLEWSKAINTRVLNGCLNGVEIFEVACHHLRIVAIKHANNFIKGQMQYH